MKPLIGIINRPEITPSNHEMMGIYRNLSNKVIKYGGVPIGIEPTEIKHYYGKENTDMTDLDFEDMKRIIDKCQAVICQGGDNFYDYDLKVIKYCYDNDIPLLGICLGMQTIGYLFNGKLQKIKSHNNGTYHDIYIDKNSKLYKILKKDKLSVNSRHSEALIKTDLKVVAYSKDNIIEAIEDKDKKFFIGVQWHPETMEDEVMDKIFDFLINN